ncbi:MAG TPA: lipocalin family protein, partial [Bacteroidales bacterium]|nr:lipocalin family protein [Bacteroidales bacterium]
IYLKENINLGDYKELYDQKFRELKDSTVFYFRNDYTYERVAKGQSTKGTWSISNDGTLVIVKMIGKEAEEKSRILELTKTNLVMSPMSESSNSKVVMHKVIDNE